MINCQRSCNSWIFSLFLMNFLPIFPFKCQFQLFLHNFHANQWKMFGASRHLQLVLEWNFFCNFAMLCQKWKTFRFASFDRCNEDFYRCRQVKTGKKLTCFCLRGGDKIGSFGQNIYPCIKAKEGREEEGLVLAPK